MKLYWYLIKSKQKTLLSYLEQYCKIDTQLWNYSLPNNIIPNIVNYMKIKEYSKQDAFSILYEYVIPDLHKLGLENVIPDLKETLDKSYTTHLQNSWDLPPDEKSQIQKQQQQIAKTYNQNFKTLEITKSNYIKE